MTPILASFLKWKSKTYWLNALTAMALIHSTGPAQEKTLTGNKTFLQVFYLKKKDSNNVITIMDYFVM